MVLLGVRIEKRKRVRLKIAQPTTHDRKRLERTICCARTDTPLLLNGHVASCAFLLYTTSAHITRARLEKIGLAPVTGLTRINRRRTEGG